MLNFLLMQPVKIVFGAGSIKDLPELLNTNNFKKPFIVTDKGIVNSGIIAKITDVLVNGDISYEIFDEVLPDAPVTLVEKGFSRCQQEKCDCVIAVGGGSTIDSAKAINLLRFNDPPILRFTDFSAPMNHSPGLITIPTTSGTGSELSDGLILSGEDHVKNAILAPNAMSEFAVLDPELAVGMPPHLTAATGFDALSHAIECCTTNLANMVVDQIALGICRTVVKWLPEAVKDGSNITARSHLMICASLSGWLLTYGHSNAAHSIGHVLGARFRIPHGIAVSYSEPYVIEFNAAAIPERTRMIGEIFGVSFNGEESPEEIGRKTRDAIIHFRDEVLDIRRAFTYEVDRSVFEDAAEDIVNELFQVFNARKMEKSDALGILNQIFAQ